jgi:hypothetical protein
MNLNRFLRSQRTETMMRDYPTTQRSTASHAAQARKRMSTRASRHNSSQKQKRRGDLDSTFKRPAFTNFQQSHETPRTG